MLELALEPDGEEPVFNFEVAETHDSFVGSERVLVHNACDAKVTPEGTDRRQSFRDLMSADEAARYDSYWEQELKGPTRQRLQAAPGTQSITNVKLSTQTGQSYVRQVVYDEYGRAVGVNDFTTHGRPLAHTDPHYDTIDSQDWNRGIRHGPPTPGLHPKTP